MAALVYNYQLGSNCYEYEDKLKRIVLGIQYDGGRWNGWQTQPDGNTVQDRLEAAITSFCQARLHTCCAGRTDAGVHALEQIVHLDTEIERPLHSWVRGVNAFLPDSIAVLWSAECPVALHNRPVGILPARTRWPTDDFHARYSALSRTYKYVLHRHPVRSPLLRGRAGWVHYAVDASAMRQAAGMLVGEHDFSSFRGAFCQAASPVRTIYGIELEERDALLIMTIRGNAFLHHMVRNIMGSLLHVGRGVRPPEWMAELLAARDRKLAAPTFMPDGLYLVRVEYDARWQLPHAPDSTGWW